MIEIDSQHVLVVVRALVMLSCEIGIGVPEILEAAHGLN